MQPNFDQGFVTPIALQNVSIWRSLYTQDHIARRGALIMSFHASKIHFSLLSTIWIVDAALLALCHSFMLVLSYHLRLYTMRRKVEFLSIISVGLRAVSLPICRQKTGKGLSHSDKEACEKTIQEYGSMLQSTMSNGRSTHQYAIS